MARKTLSRPVLILAALALVGAGMTWAFWPRATIVDMGTVRQGTLRVTIDEEGRTRVTEAYVVSTPIAGRLLRVEAHPGDPVEAGTTVVARMRPSNPETLDVRTREQALAAVEAAKAALLVAQADLEAAEADQALTGADLDRTRRLAASGTASQAALDRAESAARAAEARVATARAAIAQRQAQLVSAQTQLIGFEDRGLLESLERRQGDEIPLRAPIDGRILQVFQENETTLAAGVPILEIGDIDTGLEVEVDLISTDAVQVTAGDAVIIDNWGGATQLAGTVTRIHPYGVTRVSALGVEEQRVAVLVRLDTPAAERPGLGHGFRVETRIVIWEEDDTVIAPSSALFRDGDGWGAFVVTGGLAERRKVRLGRDNGLEAQVLDGLAPGETLVLYPPADLADGTRVAPRRVE